LKRLLIYTILNLHILNSFDWIISQIDFNVERV
jgi:hypothetical protein